MKEVFPDLITSLPLAKLPLPGAQAWLLHGAPRQVVFFRLEPGSSIPDHAHGAQWGIVVEGEVEMTIDGQCRVYGRGDCYSIPEGVTHSARCEKGALALDVFAESNRYSPQTEGHTPKRE